MDIKETLKEGIEFKDTNISQKTLDKKGFEDIESFVKQVMGDYLEQTDLATTDSTNYFPTRLDPNIYDTGVLYGMSPVLTYLESKGRRAPTDTREVEYIQLKSGFAGEWLDETETTSGAGTATTGTATADIKFLAMPITMSDIIGKGASSTARAQLMNFAQEGLRETLNAQIVSGSKGSKSFDGLDTIANASGTKIDLHGTDPMDLATLNAMDTTFCDTLKSKPTFIMTSAVVEDQIEADMMSIVRDMNTANITAGIDVPVFRSDAGEIPIIVDPNVPKTATQRRLDMLNERHIFIQDFMTPSLVAKGRAKPLASDSWLVQGIVQYHVSPSQTVQAINVL